MSARPSVGIFGGRGYLGQALYAFLRAKNTDCWVIGRQSCQEAALQSQKHYRSSIPSLQEAVAGADTVFHFASVTTPALGEKKPLLDLENIALTLALAEACEKSRVRHLIFASSGGTVYGDLSEPASEDFPTRPRCSYGIAKLASEQYLSHFSRRSNVNVTVLRMSNVYGGNQIKKGEQGVVSYLFDHILNGRPVHLLGDTVRDYIFVDDVLNALACVLDRPSGFQIYNISTGVGTSLISLAKLMFSLAGKPENIVPGERRPFDLPYNVLRNTKAVEQLGWAPQHRLEECLSKHLKSRVFCP